MKVIAGILLALILLVAGYLGYTHFVTNPAVAEQILSDPDSELAHRVMLLSLPDQDGVRVIPVNYLREGEQVFAGADGGWWRSLAAGNVPVTLQVRGKTLVGRARVELEDQAYIDQVFSRLRPTVPGWLPDWANGKLVVIDLDPEQE